jgi:CheY-like chemotaxis protein
MDVRAWTVCIVEPNKFERQIIMDLLRNAGVEKVKAYDDALAALDVLEVYNANVVITSFELGDMDAAMWTKAFRRNKKLANRKAAVFVTSAAFSLNMAEQCRHAGANALIGKPLSAKVLLATINKVLSKPREFIDAEGYVGPCRRAGIVTAGAPRKRRTADAAPVAAEAPTLTQTLEQAVAVLSSAAAALVGHSGGLDKCEPALRQVQAYAVNAGDGPLMRACAAFALQLSATRTQRAEVWRPAVEFCAHGVAQLAALPATAENAELRDGLAERVRGAVAKAATLRAA